MNNKSSYTIPLLAIIILMNAVLIYFSFLNINSKKANEYESEKEQDAVLKNYYLENTFVEFLLNDNIEIKEFVEKIRDNNIYNIDTTKTILVFHYSSLNCNPCIEFAKNKLDEYFPIKENIILFAANYKKNADLGFEEAINIGVIKLNIPLEDTNIPFLYIIKNNMIMHVFTPNPNYPEYLDQYLKMIKKRYYNQ
ncbi:MAG: hypothetical protein ACK5KT_09120 [Dysgonomonas sp.]